MCVVWCVCVCVCAVCVLCMYAWSISFPLKLTFNPLFILFHSFLLQLYCVTCYSVSNCSLQCQVAKFPRHIPLDAAKHDSNPAAYQLYICHGSDFTLHGRTQFDTYTAWHTLMQILLSRNSSFNFSPIFAKLGRIYHSNTGGDLR